MPIVIPPGHDSQQETRERVQLLIDDAEQELEVATEAAVRWVERVADLRQWARELAGSTFDTVPPAE